MKKISGLLLLRFAVASIFLIHPFYRILSGGVSPFGTEFLDKKGFYPIGLYIAWGITIFEIIGSILLLLNYRTQLVALLFILHIFSGIVLVHFREGWFVVGGGRNGFEYSVLIIFCFLAIAFPDSLSLKKDSTRQKII